MLIQQLMREINELKQELARIKAEVGISILDMSIQFQSQMPEVTCSRLRLLPPTVM